MKWVPAYLEYTRKELEEFSPRAPWWRRLSHDCVRKTYKVTHRPCNCFVEYCGTCHKVNESYACLRHGDFHYHRTRNHL